MTNLNDLSTYNFPTPITFGFGALAQLTPLLQGRSRPFVVADRGVIDLPFMGEIKKMLNPFDADYFSDFSGNPLASHLVAGVNAAKAHNPDVFVIVGGGASLDVGKGIALGYGYDGDVFDFENGAQPVKHAVPFMIAIPTTSGTGSEVGRAAVVSDDQTKAKKILFAPQLLPNHVIADPELTLGLPAAITAATGMDALTHCIEAYLSKGFHPICDGIALEGIRLIHGALADVFKDGANRKGRRDMLAASLMGAVAFQKGLGVTHSCAHALSTEFDLHHGLANALMLPACMRFNMETEGSRFRVLASIIGASDGAGFIAWIEELISELKLPRTLAEAGASITDNLIHTAIHDFCHTENPRPVTEKDFRDIYGATQ